MNNLTSAIWSVDEATEAFCASMYPLVEVLERINRLDTPTVRAALLGGPDTPTHSAALQRNDRAVLARHSKLVTALASRPELVAMRFDEIMVDNVDGLTSAVGNDIGQNETRHAA